MKSLIKFFKGLGGKDLPKVVTEEKELTPEEKENQELLRLGATDLDMELVRKLRQLRNDGKVTVMCHHSGKPLQYRNVAGVDRHFKVKVGEYKFRIAYTNPVCYGFYVQNLGYEILKLDVFSNNDVMRYVTKLADNFCTDVLNKYNAKQMKVRSEKLKENTELCLSKLNNI